VTVKAPTFSAERAPLSRFPSESIHSRAALAVKVVHTAWFALVSASIIHIFVVGLLNRPSRWTRAALVAALLEGAVFLANAGRCPLTQLAENLGASSGRVSDIFLPRWFADRIPQIYTPPLVVGLAALLIHRWRRAR
jgi:hypothetical protein